MSSQDNPGKEILSKHEETFEKPADAFIFVVIFCIVQIVLIILFAVWTDYPQTVATLENDLSIYGYTRDVNVMIFFGFGFLMTFLRRYGYSAVGYTLMVSALVAEWSFLLQGFFETISSGNGFSTYDVGVYELLNGLFCAAAVMISFGAILGKVSPIQLLLLGVIEPIFYWLNIYICIFKLQALDIGGGMTIHTFGAYFGLAMTFFLTTEKTLSHKDNGSIYNADLFSLSGTIFLWVMWPSFNAASADPANGQVRAITNTFLSLCGSTLSAFIFSRLVSKSKFDVVHIQNSTLAGGVAMGVAANLIVTPAGAIVCGFVAGIISVIGYRFLSDLLASHFRIQDTCGVNNLHGMPGILSCLIGIFTVLRANNIQNQYNADVLNDYAAYFPHGNLQFGYQIGTMFITLCIAIFGGVVTGFLLRAISRKDQYLEKTNGYFNDSPFWKVPFDYKELNDDSALELSSLNVSGGENLSPENV